MDILIVDNSRLYAQILESNLDPGKNTIHYYQSPDIAYNSAKQQRFDYVCVSYFLKQTDGIDFACQLRAIEGYANVPIILFASKHEVAISKKALASGITDIFYKEDDFQELIAHIVRFSQRKNKINAEVLLVEDSISQQQVIQHLLENSGLSVTTFENGSSAFESFLQMDYDLVITDILLEGHISGVKLLNMIRRLDSEKGDVPILAITAFDSLSRRVDLFCRGVSDYVQKPIVEEEFLARVSNLINNQRLLKLLREQRKAIEEATEDELSVMACAFESSDAILIADAFGHIIRTNQSFLDISGYTNEEVIGKNLWSFSFTGDDKASSAQTIQAIQKDLLETDYIWQGKGKNKRKNGEIYNTQIKISVTRNYDQEIRHYVVVFSDISKKEEAEARLLQREYYDEVTSLANRKLLMKELESDYIAAISEKTFGAVLFVNLSRFKAINESLGHHIGDLLLIEVAQRLKNIITSHGTVAKIGGHKFVVLLPKLCKSKDELSSKANYFAEQINTAIAQPYSIEEHPMRLDAHTGVSFFPYGQKSIHDIVKQAELANYSAQLDKTGVFFFTESMQDAVNQTHYIEQNLGQALKNDELSLLFQPQYDVFSNIVGAEALLRWEHDGKLIPPDLFIPVAEQNRQIEVIGQWVLQAAVETVELWRQSKIISSSFKIAINVSPVQYLQDSFIASIEQLIEQYPESMKLLQLELTESIFIEKIDSVVAKMKQIKDLGLQIAIDDFGTGYSSLSYLTKLPISFLKIDKSFVRDINIDENKEVIVETIISMAHHMGMKVIAEGVETKRQLLFLRAKKCEFYQGYLFSKPLTVMQFKELLCSHPQDNMALL